MKVPGSAHRLLPARARWMTRNRQTLRRVLPGDIFRLSQMMQRCDVVEVFYDRLILRLAADRTSEHWAIDRTRQMRWRGCCAGRTRAQYCA